MSNQDATTTAASITHLWRWPVKGLGGQPLSAVTCTPGNLFPYDRAFAIENGPSGFDAASPAHVKKIRFVCMVHQPDTGRMGAHYDEATGTLAITTLDGRSMSIDPEAPDALETLAGELVEKGVRGPLKLRKADDLSTGHGFTDVPDRWISIQNRASIAKLEETVGAPLAPERLRANVLIEGWDAFAEEDLVGQRVRLGEAVIEVAAPINRCRAIDVNPTTSQMDQDLVRTLVGLNGKPSLGIYAKVVTGGAMKPGDAVAVL